MSKSVVNLTLDVLALILFLAMIFTGFIIKYPLPPGTNKSLTLWGLERHSYGVIHYWISIALLITLLLHLIFHWQWVTSTIGKKIFRITTNKTHSIRAGMITVFIILFSFSLFAFVAYRSVTPIGSGSNCGNSAQQTPGLNKLLVTESGEAPIDFWKEVYPIFEVNCINCHGPRKQLGGFRADDRDNYFGKRGLETLVIPGKSKESALIQIVSGMRPNMKSADAHRLPQADIAILSKWIDQGANWPE